VWWLCGGGPGTAQASTCAKGRGMACTQAQMLHPSTTHTHPKGSDKCLVMLAYGPSPVT